MTDHDDTLAGLAALVGVVFLAIAGALAVLWWVTRP